MINKNVFLFLIFFTINSSAELVVVNFRNLSLNDFIQMVGKITGKNIFTDKYYFKSTMSYPSMAIEKKELIPLLRIFLQEEGFMLVDKGYVYHVTKIDFSQKKVPSNNLIINKTLFNKLTNINDVHILNGNILLNPIYTNRGIYIYRSSFNYFAKNTDEIWENIGISEYKEKEKLKGFKINYIKKESYFERLNLKKDDILKTINGKELISYAVALSIFNEIEAIETLTLTIHRDNKIMELKYEIK